MTLETHRLSQTTPVSYVACLDMLLEIRTYFDPCEEPRYGHSFVPADPSIVCVVICGTNNDWYCDAKSDRHDVDRVSRDDTECLEAPIYHSHSIDSVFFTVVPNVAGAPLIGVLLPPVTSKHALAM